MPLLLSLATSLSARSDPGLAGGWEVAQAQIPQRLGPSGRKIPSANAPAATTNTPAGAPAFPPSPAARVSTPTPNAPVSTPAPATAGAAAATNTTEPANIHYDFTGGIPVLQLLEIYQELVGRTLLYTIAGPSAVPKDTVVTLKTEGNLTHSEAIIAIETILGMNGVTIVPIGDKFAKVVGEPAAPGAGGLISTNTANMPIAGKMVTQIVQIRYTDVKDLADVLTPFSKMQKAIIALPSTQTIILRDYAENVNRMMEMVKKIDVASPLIIKPKIIAIKYAWLPTWRRLSAPWAPVAAHRWRSSSGATGFGGRGSSGFGQNGGMGSSMGGGMNGIMGQTGGYPGQGG